MDVTNLEPVSAYSYTHGFGVAPHGQYNTTESMQQACRFALEDLNSNLFMSVYIEQFKTGDISHYSFPELSVTDSVLAFEGSISKVDSFYKDGFSYCIAVDEMHTPQTVSSVPDLEQLKIAPVNENGVWFALGVEKLSRYNPSVAWIKSKNNALKDLAGTITMLVQSSQLSMDNQSVEFTYFKSFVLYKNIAVVRRFVSPGGDFVSVVAVREADITRVE